MKIKCNVLNETVKLPELCAVTGEKNNTLQQRPVYKSYFIGLGVMRTVYPIPMTEAGWNQYRKSLTWAERFYEGVVSVCIAIPLLGPIAYLFLMIYLWPILLLNRVYRIFKKNQSKLSVKREGEAPFVRGNFIEVPSEKFAEEFVKQNTHLGARVV